MIIELAFALILGILAGTFTGLAPGIHINLIASLLLLSQSSPSPDLVLPFVIFIIAMSITHTFIDFIPSIFLGAPEEDTFLSLLPGHELFLEGRAQEAVVLTLYGALAAIPIVLITIPLYLLFLPSIYASFKFLLPFLLIFFSGYLILREKKILFSAIVFFLSGFLGYATFNLPLKEPLLPLLTGLFGISSLLSSLKEKNTSPHQEVLPLKKITLTKREKIRGFTAALLSAPFCSFLPGIGSSHAATFGSELIPQTRRSFLFLTGCISTTVMMLSFITLIAINKSRSGTASAVHQFLPNLLNHLPAISITFILSALAAFGIGLLLSRTFAKSINKINYRVLTQTIIIFLIALNIAFALFSYAGNPLSGILHLLVLGTSTALGLFCIYSDTRRIQLMGALILPTIVFYLFN